jgi:hypothetical protein
MTQRIKILVVLLSTFCLSHCQDGPNGKRIFGFGMTGQPTDHSQSGSYFTAGNNGGGDVVAFLESLRRNNAPVSQKSNTGVVKNSDIDWKALCKDLGFSQGKDTDQDELTDDCEIALAKQNLPEYTALDRMSYNGWIVGGRYFNRKNGKMIAKHLVALEDIRPYINVSLKN